MRPLVVVALVDYAALLPAEVRAALRRWEASFPVSTWRVEGIHVWPLVRQHLGFRLLALGQPERPPISSVPRYRALEPLELLKTARARLADPRGDVSTPTRADVVFLSRPGNRTLVDGAYHDRFFDPIADLLDQRGRSSLHLEYHDAGVDYRLPRRRPSLLIRPPISWQQLRAALRRVRSRPPVLEGYAELCRTVLAEAGVASLPPQRLQERLLAITYGARYFNRVLAHSGARLALAFCYYNLVGMALCIAARKRGIPFVDVQHGVTRSNPAYDGFSAFPEGGYALLPDHFWCWSEADAEPVRQWPAAVRSHHQAFVAGHPWVAFWQEDHPRVDRYDRQIASIRGASLTVLASLSNSSGFSETLRRIIDLAPPDWTFWVRLHPRMDSERRAIATYCREHLGSRGHVELPTDLPLPIVLRHADVHIAHNSTVFQEATALGVPSVAVDRRAVDTFAAEIESGWVVFAEGDDAVEALASQSKRRSTLPKTALYPSREALGRALDPLLSTAPIDRSATDQ